MESKRVPVVHRHNALIQLWISILEMELKQSGQPPLTPDAIARREKGYCHGIAMMGLQAALQGDEALETYNSRINKLADKYNQALRKASGDKEKALNELIKQADELKNSVVQKTQALRAKKFKELKETESKKIKIEKLKKSKLLELRVKKFRSLSSAELEQLKIKKSQQINDRFEAWDKIVLRLEDFDVDETEIKIADSELDKVTINPTDLPINSDEVMTPEEKSFYDTLAFFNGFELYGRRTLHPDVLIKEKYPTVETFSTSHISELVAPGPDENPLSKGMKVLYQTTNKEHDYKMHSYEVDSLHEYLKTLEKAAIESELKKSVGFVFTSHDIESKESNMSHTITVKFNPNNKKWIMIDSNQLPTIEEELSVDLPRKLMKGFFGIKDIGITVVTDNTDQPEHNASLKKFQDKIELANLDKIIKNSNATQLQEILQEQIRMSYSHFSFSDIYIKKIFTKIKEKLNNEILFKDSLQKTLSVACQSNCSQIIPILLQLYKEENININGEEGKINQEKPLIYAVYYYSYHVIEKLINDGSDISKKSYDDMIEIAFTKKRFNVIKLIIERCPKHFDGNHQIIKNILKYAMENSDVTLASSIYNKMTLAQLDNDDLFAKIIDHKNKQFFTEYVNAIINHSKPNISNIISSLDLLLARILKSSESNDKVIKLLPTLFNIYGNYLNNSDILKNITIMEKLKNAFISSIDKNNQRVVKYLLKCELPEANRSESKSIYPTNISDHLLNSPLKGNKTPLMMAFEKNNLKMFDLLIKSGAKLVDIKVPKAEKKAGQKVEASEDPYTLIRAIIRSGNVEFTRYIFKELELNSKKYPGILQKIAKNIDMQNVFKMKPEFISLILNTRINTLNMEYKEKNEFYQFIKDDFETLLIEATKFISSDPKSLTILTDIASKYMNTLPRDDTTQVGIKHILINFLFYKSLDNINGETKIAVIAKMLEDFPDLIHYQDNDGKTLLMRAAETIKKNIESGELEQQNYNMDLLIYLFEKTDNKTFESIKDSHKKSTLHYLIETGNTDLVNILVDHAPQLINLKDDQGMTPIMCAAKAGDVNMLYHLLYSLSANPDLTLKNVPDQQTVLMNVPDQQTVLMMLIQDSHKFVSPDPVKLTSIIRKLIPDLQTFELTSGQSVNDFETNRAGDQSLISTYIKVRLAELDYMSNLVNQFEQRNARYSQTSNQTEVTPDLSVLAPQQVARKMLEPDRPAEKKRLENTTRLLSSLSGPVPTRGSTLPDPLSRQPLVQRTGEPATVERKNQTQSLPPVSGPVAGSGRTVLAPLRPPSALRTHSILNQANQQTNQQANQQQPKTKEPGKGKVILPPVIGKNK